jgi:hypothetical protein
LNATLIDTFVRWFVLLLSLIGLLLPSACSGNSDTSVALSPPPAPTSTTSPLPAPSPTISAPAADPTPIPSTLITNAAELDGMPVTVGQTVVLQAATSVEWIDGTGKLLGQGSSLSYPASTVKMETITAKAGGASARISFTVSPPDVIVAPHVKVLSDAAKAAVVSLDLTKGELKLQESDLLPTIFVGDVLIRAEGSVPPVKVSEIERLNGQLQLKVEPVLPKQLIEKGAATFEQEIDWSGESGAISLIDTSDDAFHLADILQPKWSGSVKSENLIFLSLNAKANTNFSWVSIYKGSIEFDKLADPAGIRKLELQQNATISAKSQIDVSGYKEWFDTNSL